MLIAEVLLPVAIRTTYSYLIDKEEIESKIKIGSFVSVPIGKNRIVGGIVVDISSQNGKQNHKLRSIEKIIYLNSVITPLQLEFWKWLSSYYLLPIGSVSYNFSPSILKSSTKQDNTEDLELRFNSLGGFEKVDYIYLNEIYNSNEKKEELLTQLSKKKKQLSLIIDILEQLEIKGCTNNFFKKKEFLDKGYSLSIISQLINSEIIFNETRKEEKSFLLPKYDGSVDNIISNKLSISVCEKLENGKPLLLESQNDTDNEIIVLNAIDKTLKEGGQILFITPRLYSYNRYKTLLEKHFSDNLVIYDKSVSKNKLFRNYFTILNNRENIVVLSNRMGVGLPFSNLKLIIVEREHDQLYQGLEHEMCFNGRDAAVYLAHLHSAKALLISSVPSVESLHNTELNKYNLISNKDSFQQKIITINKNAIASSERKLYNSSSERRFLSKLVIDEIEKRCANGEIVLLYQNRKGFATTLECADCGSIQYCDCCNSVLVYYKNNNNLKCRYCGKTYNNTTQCKNCSSYNIVKHGVGSENVEEKVSKLFPLLRIARIDANYSENTKAFNSTLEDIYNGKIDIIIGTQLVTTLPPIKNLTMLAVVNGDNLFTLPDYRNVERAFQLLTSLRNIVVNDKESLMVLQMSQQGDFTKNFIQNNYYPIFHKELYDRKEFYYPPFCRMIVYRIEHNTESELINVSNRFVAELRKGLNLRISEPTPPLVDKINNYYIREIIIKSPLGKDFTKSKLYSFDIASKILRKFKYKIKVY